MTEQVLRANFSSARVMESDHSFRLHPIIAKLMNSLMK